MDCNFMFRCRSYFPISNRSLEEVLKLNTLFVMDLSCWRVSNFSYLIANTPLLPKICDWAKYHNRHSSKSIRVTMLSFCQSDSLMSQSESFWQKNSLVTHIFFDLCLFKHFSPVANFGQQSLYWFDAKWAWISASYFSGPKRAIAKKFYRCECHWLN